MNLTLFQPRGGADYAHHISACPPGFAYLTTSLTETHFLELVKRSTFRSKWIWHLSWFRVYLRFLHSQSFLRLSILLYIFLKLAFFDIFGLFSKFVNYVDVIIRIILSFTFSTWEHCMLWFDDFFLQNFVKNCGRIKQFVKLRLSIFSILLPFQYSSTSLMSSSSDSPEKWIELDPSII